MSFQRGIPKYPEKGDLYRYRSTEEEYKKEFKKE
jgi:hypothetical protein